MKKIKNILKKNSPEKLAEELEMSYKRMKKEGEEHPIDKTVKNVMKKIQENPEPRNVEKILKAVKDNEGIPDRVFEKTSTIISETNEIPDRVITDVIEKSETSISDEAINRIIEEGKIDVKERINLMHNLEDKAIIEKRVENELNILYRVCENKRDDEVVDRVKELKKFLNYDDVNEQLQMLIQQVVAKKMAENYYSDVSKGTNIYTLSQIMPVEDMIENDLPSMVQNEYQKIEENREKKEGRFNKKGLKIQILIEMGKKIAYKYDETGVFIIPQSKNMKIIDKDEEEMFIKTIQTYSRKQLSKQEVIDIDEQIRGNCNNVQIKENILINAIKGIPENNKTRSIDFLIKILENEEALKTLEMLDESGLIEKFNDISEEKRIKTINSIGNVLNKSKYKVAASFPKIKNNQKIDICQWNQEGR